MQIIMHILAWFRWSNWNAANINPDKNKVFTKSGWKYHYHYNINEDNIQTILFRSFWLTKFKLKNLVFMQVFHTKTAKKSGEKKKSLKKMLTTWLEIVFAISFRFFNCNDNSIALTCTQTLFLLWLHFFF